MNEKHSSRAKSFPVIPIPSREALSTFNVILDATKNLILSSLGLSTLLFFFFPSIQILVRDRVMGEAAWFYVGDWIPVKRAWREGKGHYTKFYLTDYDFDVQDAMVRSGTVLLSTGQASLGRRGPNIQNLTKVAIFKNQCVKVLESASHDVPGHSGASVPDKAVWVRALPIACGN